LLSRTSSPSSTWVRSGFRNRFVLDPFSSNALVILDLFIQII